MDIFGSLVSRPTSTAVMMPKVPSDPMNRSIRSMCGDANRPEVLLVRGIG
jgi:hypothetical protein